MYELFGESKNNDKNLFFFCVFAGKKENYFIFYNKSTEMGGFTQLNR